MHQLVQCWVGIVGNDRVQPVSRSAVKEVILQTGKESWATATHGAAGAKAPGVGRMHCKWAAHHRDSKERHTQPVLDLLLYSPGPPKPGCNFSASPARA